MKKINKKNILLIFVIIFVSGLAFSSPNTGASINQEEQNVKKNQTVTNALKTNNHKQEKSINIEKDKDNNKNTYIEINIFGIKLK